ncbi:TAXI family TRAP transporter solute-binding subunit [Succinispira mobilis]|uniref:TAXI family TRAP transporter solute-binding subunit n=1 Tax=Succinispira mobilis TaxID=78120 RepID=UPI00036FA4BD|nr:TAXI family TRAP transporter solute-binding subunit [Succinispira mobilis]
MNKKLTALLVTGVLVSGLVAGCGGDKKADQKPAAKQQFVNIATGGTAGTYYPIGGAMAEILNKNIPGVNASAQSTGASVANVNLLSTGKVDLAFVQNDIAYYALNGTEMFKDKKVANLKGIATLYPETVQIITLQKSGIKKLSEAKGKRVAVGAAGSGVEANARQVLEANGITYSDIKVQYLSFAEAAGALKDGNVDIAFVTAGIPTAAIQDISTQNPVALLSVDAQQADGLIKKYPFYTKQVIPAKTYPGQEQDINTVAVKAMLVATDKMSDDLSYNIAKALYTNTDRLKSSHAIAKNISKATATEGMSLPMAAGADKYFKEK